MLGTVAQAIALTTYGNEALRPGCAIDAAAFYPSNSTFQFCEYVRFAEAVAWAEDPIAWFDRLKKDGVRALRLHHGSTGEKTLGGYHVPGRMVAGFAGESRWSIEAIAARGSDWWEPRWELGDRARRDRRIWRVTYGRIARDQPTRSPEPEDLESLKRELDAALVAIEGYARSHRLENFASLFERGRAQLSSDRPGDGVDHSDLAPPGQLSLTAQQLLAASQLGWVFGGMGSWNDVSRADADDAEYERSSQRLFGLLNRTYVAVANTTASRT